MLKIGGRWAERIEELLAPHTVEVGPVEPRWLAEDEGGCAYCGRERPWSEQARRFCSEGCKAMAGKRRAMGKPEARCATVEVTATCAECAGEFTYVRRSKPRLMCSDACRAVTKKKLKAQRRLHPPTS